MTMGARKGAQFERDICRKLSYWVSKGERGDLFWRSSQSGGRATTERRKGRKAGAHAGDISATHPDGQAFLANFVVECKFLKRLEMEQWLHGRKGMVERIWLKPRQEARHYRKQPFVVVKENNQRAKLLVTERGLNILGIHEGGYVAGMPPRIYFEQYDCRMFDFEDFIEGVEY